MRANERAGLCFLVISYPEPAVRPTVSGRNVQPEGQVARWRPCADVFTLHVACCALTRSRNAPFFFLGAISDQRASPFGSAPSGSAPGSSYFAGVFVAGGLLPWALTTLGLSIFLAPTGRAEAANGRIGSSLSVFSQICFT